MTAQEGRGKVELPQLRRHRIGDLPAAMSRRTAEETRGGVDDPVAPVVPEIHAFGAHDHPGIALEIAIGRERHPVLVERNPLLRRVILDLEFGMAHRVLPAWRGGAAWQPSRPS